MKEARRTRNLNRSCPKPISYFGKERKSFVIEEDKNSLIVGTTFRHQIRFLFFFNKKNTSQNPFKERESCSRIELQSKGAGAIINDYTDYCPLFTSLL